MRKKSAFDFCLCCLQRITDEGSGHFIENPAVQFTADAKNGVFDDLTDEEYQVALDEVEQIASIWDNKPRMTAGAILLYVLERMPASPEQLDAIAKPLAELLDWPDPERPEGSGASRTTLRPVLKRACAVRSPREIRDSISPRVMGQPEAVKAAAMITYNHLSGRRSNAVFCGPSGCGKSEIWRALSGEYPGLVRMVDFSRFSAEGWNGSLHLRDIFQGISSDDIRQRGLIVVLDEADKILCEHAVGSGGTDHNALLQNDLLKMMDGDVIEFGDDNKKSAFSVDCSKVSVVMLGAFEKLLEGKVRDARHIGFGSGAAGADAGNHRDISHDDLIRAGMRREVAGRVNKIVALDPLSPDDYRAILKGPMLSSVRKSVKRHIRMDDATADELVARAVKSGLGVRWMRSAVCNAVDEVLFDDPYAGHRIDLSGRSF